MSFHDDAFLQALQGLTQKLGLQGHVQGQRPSSEAQELSLKQKLRVLIMMREPVENIKGMIEELEKLGTNLAPEYQLARAHELDEVATRLEAHAVARAPKMNKQRI